MAGNVRLLKKATLAAVILALAAAMGFQLVHNRGKDSIPEGFTGGNGRVEATEIDISAGMPGRVYDVMVKEGDLVTKNQVLATMDTRALKAMLRQAEAEVKRAKISKSIVQAKLDEVRNRMSLADKELRRSKILYSKGINTRQQLDRDQTQKNVCNDEHAGLLSRISETDAGIESAIALTERLKAEIDDCSLRTSVNGRVQSRLAEPGEVLPAGGKVLSVISLDDMYMNVYLPEKPAGRVSVGTEARVVLDSIPDKPFPAKVAFVSDKAQFTPKEVEAQEERQKLVFRVKVRMDGRSDPSLKPGMPGVAYVRLDHKTQWPEKLK